MPLIKLEKYTNVFVETGSYRGEGIEFALKSGYEKILSIELCDSHYKFCVNKFKDNPKVKIHQGDSGIILGGIIKDINEPITFWLDGHWMTQDPEGYCGSKQFPIMEEIEQIKKHPVKNHVILIDDIADIQNSGAVNLKNLINAIISINNLYKINYIDSTNTRDILLAQVQ